MGHIDKKVTTRVRVSFSRLEVLEKLGFDTADAFYVALDDYGRTGITFDVSSDKAGKYEPKTDSEPPATPPATPPAKRPWYDATARLLRSP